ncbi:C-type cytochrome biogenesis protein [Xanthomonas citri pv. fuscans CFBP 6996]|uniref:tetratricopeptide repeat protein n=1 Tax=Xanthomonas citri TaxID=346 RepID=UPI000C1914EA|nr:C-type cytochrome biogenesis protein [Xanthomonas citri]ATS51394.1 C-type cytochrome biogenesis protein [Xanthomonas citri pv. phaseoli var. fuscans]ATS57124.1 C-type cytochrome biogenesis protein [Xanthomonas citri pv. phaseoli var. fuscans]ATS58872.1 C-type cytochrome biogenesis protein [Xanthomonas citri pv. phaseoli var. fuscans]PTY32048.1 C-type cytochrome biogenesis protein [Xanthomonas citri pv. fuscans CFBP 6996]QWN16000.1 C-type cytochrome biogenesis protein [Xanthomonas citri]
MVMAGFYVASAVLVALALLLLLAPLLRRPTGSGHAHYRLAILLALGLPLATAGLYRLVGAPEAIVTHVDAAQPAQVAPLPPSAVAAASATADAQEPALDRLMQQARTFEQNDRPAEAREAYAQVLRIAPDISAAIVGWVAADMATHDDFAIDAASRARLQRVIAREPDNQRGLWLLGISDFQQQDFAAATAHWRHLHGLLETGSPMQKAVADKIAVAESMASARQSAGGTR